MDDSSNTALLLLVGLVFAVIVAGFFLLPQASPAGNVVRDPDPCSSCDGTPVCAALGSTVYTYPNACAATCGGARVVYEKKCTEIPRAVA